MKLEQSNLNINLEKLTSNSALIKWNSISFGSSSVSRNVYYKLQYWQKNKQDVSTYDLLNSTELKLTNLKPNSDYIVQLVALLSELSTSTGIVSPAQQNPIVMSSEIATKHFRTLVSDIDAPKSVQVVRYEADKMNVKWEPLLIYDDNKPLIKGYRIYYKPQMPASPLFASNDDYSIPMLSTTTAPSADEWRYVELIGDKNTELNIDQLSESKDYAVKIVAIDFSNNEGAESVMSYAMRVGPPNNAPASDNNNISGNNYDSAAGNEDELQEIDPASLSHSNKIDRVRELEILEYTSTYVKFSWLPPQSKHLLKISSYLIRYSDRLKWYKDARGNNVSEQSRVALSVQVPAREENIKITWLVTSLEPNTEYDFNISVVMPDKTQGPPVRMRIKTRRDKPFAVERPQVLDTYSDNTVLIKTANASEKYGSISKYWLVVSPLGFDNVAGTGSSFLATAYDVAINSHEPPKLDINSLLRFSIFNNTHPKLYANESTYIAAEFQSIYWPPKFILGDGRLYDRFFNRQLIKGIFYRAYIIAFTDDSAPHPAPVFIDSSSSTQSKQANMLGLADLVGQGGGYSKASTPISGNIEGDLFNYSSYSEMFNTRSADVGAQKPGHHMNPLSNIGPSDYYNILWIAGAIACFIFLFIMIILVSVHFMNKKQRKSSSFAGGGVTATATHGSSGADLAVVQANGHTISMSMHNGHGAASTAAVMGTLSRAGTLTATNKSPLAGQAPSSATSSSTMTTTATTATGITHHHHHQQQQRSFVDTTASINKYGVVSTNTLKSSSTLNGKSNKMKKNGTTGAAAASAGGVTTASSTSASNTGGSSSSSSSTSSPTTASPTTALLSCSINNNSSSNNVANGSQNSHSNSTNNTNILTTNSSQLLNGGSGGGISAATGALISTNGLLTAASPLRTNPNIAHPLANSTSPISNNLMMSASESLYTSIEVTQKLLKQQMHQSNSLNGGAGGSSTHGTMSNGGNNLYDNNGPMMMMMMMMSNNTFNGNNGTLGRGGSGAIKFKSHHHNGNGDISSDPIEHRRINYPTAALSEHPPLHVDELYSYIERLKANNNQKFSIEYESIEPNQQFTWEHSVMDIQSTPFNPYQPGVLKTGSD
jgi:hypothetical protein